MLLTRKIKWAAAFILAALQPVAIALQQQQQQQHAPPPLSSLASVAISPDSNDRDMPGITNFWGSVGSVNNDIMGLSQVLLPPYVDVGVPTSIVSLSGGVPSGCSPETMGAWTIGSDDQYFFLVSSTPTMRTYNLTCATSGCTSWHTASATMPYPFTSFHIIYNEIPPNKPFQDNGAFDLSCTIISYPSGSWCAKNENPSCTPSTGGIPVEGWQWTPTSFFKYGGPALSETRMLFEGNGVLQKLTVTAGADGQLDGLTVSLTGAMRAYPSGLSWTTNQPHSTQGFNASLVSVESPSGVMTQAMLTCDTTSSACSVWVFSVCDITNTGTGTTTSVFSSDPLNLTLVGTSVVATLPPIPSSSSLTLAVALLVGSDASEALELAATVADAPSFAIAWDSFATLWEARWLDAFTPKPAATTEADGDEASSSSSSSSSSSYHYSGNLPILQLEESAVGTSIQRLYYMSVLSILLMERTNLPKLFDRVYLTGTGNALCDMQIGGTMQFAWDQTFYGTLQALLDPEAQRKDLALWIGQPIGSIFGVELDTLAVGGDFYAFNALSLYRAFSTYLRATNDTSFLAQSESYLETLADFYLPYVKNPSNSTLADYSGGANNYLECVPTYKHATAGLQGGNAFMAYDLAELRALQGNTTGASLLLARAAAIAAESIETMYISNTSGKQNGTNPGDIGGWWRVIDTSPSGKETVEVRHVVDFTYATMGFCSTRWNECSFNDTIKSQMIDFFQRQLLIPFTGSWIRALSTLDGAAPVERIDHGSTGSYDAWPALSFDALVSLEGGFGTAVPYLASVGLAINEGPMAQAHAIANDGVSVFKSTGGCNRYIANNGAAFAESILRLLFGYEVPYGAQLTNTTLFAPTLGNVSRGGITGSMSCIRGPTTSGQTQLYLTATLPPPPAVGVSWVWSETC